MFLKISRMIDPEKNFLLRKGKRLGDKNFEAELQVLYKLTDGRLIVHHQFNSPLRNDQLKRIDPWLAEQRFQVKIS
jgi:hypothetical protein